MIVSFQDVAGVTYQLTHKVCVWSDLSPSFKLEGPVWVITDYEAMANRIFNEFCRSKVSKKTRAGIIEELKKAIPDRIQVAA